MLGTAGVPTSGVTAVALNVTAICPSADTWVTVTPAGSKARASGALKVPAGRTRSGIVIAPVGGAGKVSLGNQSGTTNVAVDVLGYYTTAKASRFHAVAPVRLLDSRSSGRAVAAGEERTLTLPKLQGIAASAMTGAVVNVTVVDNTGAGAVSVRPAGAAVTATSTVHYAKGEVLKNKAITGLTGGALKLRNAGAGTHVIVDLVGFYAPANLAGATGSGRYTPVAPKRVLDTRTATAGALATNSSRSFTVSGTGPVPADAKAVVVTLTATSATLPTYLTAYRAGTTRPSASDVSTVPGEVRSNVAVVPVDPKTRKARVYNYSGSTHTVADVVGFIR